MIKDEVGSVDGFGVLAMFEAEGSNFRLKFVDGTVSEEDIMFLIAVCINVYC